eukprot:TRINITY_DN3065_c0_g1_i23.p1 TRINITY_DN3065_c0_g1~~TRINITY_DN3065_c0_g1_i23.p1  ORF type:complete len:760 (+),score=134.01 TRINITY_DN3065_c0_g1_i23:117-2396(+)
MITTTCISYFLSPLDTSEEASRKKIMVASTVFSVVLNTGLFLSFNSSFGNVYYYFVVMQLICGYLSLLKWFLTKKMLLNEVILLSALWVVSISVGDLVSTSEGGPSLWPFAVVVLDVLLLCQVPTRQVNAMVFLLVVYISLKSIESAVRFGLFDAVAEIKLRYLRECYTFTQEEFSNAPCKVSFSHAFGMFISGAGVLLLDFYCTRKFAYGMQSERQKLAASVSLAERVVSALVRFDLEEAEQNINSVDTTPLTEVLSQLLHNLHQYRPYLPDSLFELSDESLQDTSYLPRVAAPQNPAAILFTDLKSSTAIWEASPDAMKRALKMHDTLIRNCISNFGGYEVKTIGDSFMVAFSTFESGCEFAMSVQDRMLSATWPFDLRLPTEFEEHGWNGLMVRIGLHFGEVTTETNPVSGREDYFGRTVNKAARLERACVPGGVAIDAEMLSEISLNDDWNHRTINEHLKGIDDNPVAIKVLMKDLLELSACRQDLERLSSKHSSLSFETASCRGRLIATIQETSEQLLMKRAATASSVWLNVESVSENNFEFEKQINTSLTKSISCLERTEGSLVTVLSCSITIGWNTTRNSPAHFENALRFVSLMYGAFSSQNEVFIGIASSPVQYGKVGTRDQRFVTVFGRCINMCSLLCQASCDIGAFALCADSPTDFPLRRPIDRWASNHGNETIVYELQAWKLKEWLTAKVHEKETTEEASWGWGGEYKEAFNRRDWESIESGRSDADHVLRIVAQMLRKGRSLRPPEF